MTVVGTWNLENLFRPGADFGPASQAVYAEKLRGLAATIDEAGVDVLAVQEVGDPDALTDLIGLLRGDWQHVTSEHFEKAHPIRVGFISRFPLEILADTAAFPVELSGTQSDDAGTLTRQMGRGALAVRVSAPGQELVLVACHLKSKLLSFPSAGGRSRFSPKDEGERARYAAYALNRRTAEAVTVRALADELLDGEGRTRPVMVLGDLNDEPQAATTQILLGPPGSELGTAGADRPDGGDASRLWNLAPRIPDDERYSRIYRGRGELIDHILASQTLLAQTQEVHMVHGRSLPSVTDDAPARRNAPASDHALLLTRLTRT
ncbi:endonuclease/exonuclease/phosphatase family protein [Actinomadura sp. DC4]|uniref:endonuclease/exonuclease/phosphatase family protein n=1 Tax=Actinomadura sp. DC4 TaxID=3055069 RepID=UPI0025B1697B|nr:endonuclease/exonuclease/phosphatase family protein [Actinomadura sp. DC4]MDN3359599.1 endonuclease/exonuclease/phosphatase family protein [Actinomadura sp. DC4]